MDSTQALESIPNHPGIRLIFIAYFNGYAASDITRITGHGLLAISPELLQKC
jgi:hypothetical protein